MFRVLFIDDDQTAHKLIRMVLPSEFTVISSLRGDRGIQLVEQRAPDIVLLDVELPDLNGIEVLKRIASIPGAPPVIMLTSYDETDIVVRAVRAGALDYLVKPYTTDVLIAALENALKANAFRSCNTDSHPALTAIIGESASIVQTKSLIARYAPSESPVLLYGESGTGKELVAKAIHAMSDRREEAFVAKNCGAIPATLMESEMFGAEKGAFTDAVSRPGSFEQANYGTLFLDEIGELPKEAQVKLLRVLEEGSITRIGGLRKVQTSVRIISATNRDIKEAVSRGDFRTDLYYRINVLPVNIPPLRHRKEDIPLLFEHFASQRAVMPAVSAGAWEKLHSHDWPGNIRELKSVVDRALLLSDNDTIGPNAVVYD